MRSRIAPGIRLVSVSVHVVQLRRPDVSGAALIEAERLSITELEADLAKITDTTAKEQVAGVLAVKNAPWGRWKRSWPLVLNR